jgi:CubicO group peptidase (beta-lactamase class C family)
MVLGMIAQIALIFSAVAHAQDGAVSVWPTRQWQTSTPEEQGMDSAALAKLIEFGARRSFDSLLIVRHGKIVLDAYYAPYVADIPHAVYSATKAVIGTLAAIALRDGLLDDTNHPLLAFFADRSVANVDDKKRAITLQSLLDMTSGIDWREPLIGRPDSAIEMERSPDWIKFILDRPVSTNPGEIFNYDSGNPHLVSGILTRLTGMSASDYAKARLFGPLGIDVWNWRHDPQGVSTGGYGLALQPRDMAKIGYLYLRQGEWEGKPLLPPAWVEKVSHATVNMNTAFEPALRYSNFFWALPEQQVYMADGYHCQLIMVYPALDIVAVTTARDFCPLGRLANLVIAAVKSDAAIAPDPAGANMLADAIREISAEKPTEASAPSEMASAVSGKTFNFPGNALGVKSIALRFADSEPRYDMEFYSRDPARPPFQWTGPIGLDGLYRKSDPSAVGIVATKGKWLNDHTLTIERLILGDGEPARRWTLRFDGDKLNLRGMDRGGSEVSIDGDLR